MNTKSMTSKTSVLKRREIAKMVTNKRIASTAKDCSELSFFMEEYPLAKSLALQAKRHDPELAGITEFISALDVFISTDNKTGWKVDRYKVLGASPYDEEATINMNFKKLALSVHPDRNKSLAANGAFRIVSEAWSLLKCRETKAVYDKSIKLLSSLPFAGRTFWTACPKCKVQFEYRRVFINRNLTCLNCRRTFLAVEMTQSSSMPTNSKPFSLSSPDPKPNPSLAPNVACGQAVIPSGVGSTLPSVPLFGAELSVREVAEQPGRKRKVDALMLETRGKANPNLMRNLSELEKREMFISKAKKVIFKKVGNLRGPPPGFPAKRK